MIYLIIMELIGKMAFEFFRNTLNYYNCSYFDMTDLYLTYINQNFIGNFFHQSAIKFAPLYSSNEKLII